MRKEAARKYSLNICKAVFRARKISGKRVGRATRVNGSHACVGFSNKVDMGWDVG